MRLSTSPWTRHSSHAIWPIRVVPGHRFICTRTFPLRQPPNHNPTPRLHLQFPSDVDRVFTAYIGVKVTKSKSEDSQTSISALPQPYAHVQQWLADPQHAPSSTEQFQMLDDTVSHLLTGQNVSPCNTPAIAPQSGQYSSVWACYWTDEAHFRKSLATLNLLQLYRGLNPAMKPRTSLWSESFVSDVSRLETVYSATDYLPGLARLPGTTTTSHLHTGYWGAARDRIPGSGQDLFVQSRGAETPSAELPRSSGTMGMSVTGTNPANMVHIRSGQFWGSCDEEERTAYLQAVEPKLRTGLAYLWDASEESGATGVRYLQNVEAVGKVHSAGSTEFRELEESCVTGFFRNMGDLENWASRHPSHLAIYAAAVKHGRRFGDARKFRTWHEVSVLKDGEARFEYVNCALEMGAARQMVVLNTEAL
ncbi:hypothetical protein N7462_008663 [Penicillium macrosclerotiorum]|uniref:uncharacterized protein n=1 Tax=Penicillium macrosclerotiorum TaxID=303699 RepID=UPI00254794A0|nr:uncharacterized protein N7462_008663 [Penicillium macrosclerotiorum]KAJ5675766.1 hypothetical protein N7462_008663 [Penicillium macrosclerotiorum]